MSKVTIFLADDHSIVREGLSLILQSEPDYEIIGEAGDGREAIELIEKLNPQIAIVDISMPSMTGIEVAKYLKKYAPDVKIIILSRHDNEEYVHQLLEFGIDGYILKDDAGDDLIRAVEEVLKGNLYLSPRIATSLVNDFILIKKSVLNKESISDGVTSPFKVLSSREREVLKLIAEGKTNTDVGELLRISPMTAKCHRANIMKKLNIHKVNELVSYAIKNGLVEI